MAIYTGRFEKLPPNPRFPNQDPTAYLKTDKQTDAEVRETLKTWCEYLATIAFSQADSIKYDNPGLTKSQAQKAGWATVDQAIRLNCDEPNTPIGADPQVYTTEYITKFCLRELAAIQKNGKPKDIKQSIIERHNWQVVHIAYARFNIESEADIKQEVLDWIDSRAIDVQVNAPQIPTRSQRLLGSIFDGL